MVLFLFFFSKMGPEIRNFCSLLLLEIYILIRGATVLYFLVRDSTNAKPIMFEFKHFPNLIGIETGRDFP